MLGPPELEKSSRGGEKPNGARFSGGFPLKPTHRQRHTSHHTMPCHYSTSHCITLHYTTLHYLTLHCIFSSLLPCLESGVTCKQTKAKRFLPGSKDSIINEGDAEKTRLDRRNVPSGVGLPVLLWAQVRPCTQARAQSTFHGSRRRTVVEQHTCSSPSLSQAKLKTVRPEPNILREPLSQLLPAPKVLQACL